MDDELMLNPASRRHWLLAKALEAARLDEALALAQAAEDFISGTAARTDDRTSSAVMGSAPTFGTEPEAQPSPLGLLNVLPVSNDQPVKNDRPLVTTEALAGLSSLASIEDVILYLRRGGEVFADDESADELLARANGKRAEQGFPPFALLPTPPTKTTAREKPERVALPRPPSRRERAEWARSVVALPAE
jgi:hypothetical protein